jgi:hypothetical protein
LAELDGAYLYADYSTGKIWAMKHDGKRHLASRNCRHLRCRSQHLPRGTMAMYGSSIMAATVSFVWCRPQGRAPATVSSAPEFAGTGFLSSSFAPFSLGANPSSRNFNVCDLTPPTGISGDRFQRRPALLDVVNDYFHQPSVHRLPNSLTPRGAKVGKGSVVPEAIRRMHNHRKGGYQLASIRHFEAGGDFLQSASVKSTEVRAA